jgi:hypothetical protein
LLLKVIASKSYRSWHKEAVITTDSYRSGNILAVIATDSYHSGNILAVIALKVIAHSKAKAITCNGVTFCSNVPTYACS